MFNFHLPDPIYERLPEIYLLVGLALILLPGNPLKWLAVLALAAVAVITRRQRRLYREAAQIRNMTTLMKKYRHSYTIEA